MFEYCVKWEIIEIAKMQLQYLFCFGNINFWNTLCLFQDEEKKGKGAYSFAITYWQISSLSVVV